MRDALIVAALIAGYMTLMAGCAVALIAVDQLRKTLRGFRKLAQLYPPFVSADSESELATGTSVEIKEQWNDDLPGRS